MYVEEIGIWPTWHRKSICKGKTIELKTLQQLTIQLEKLKLDPYLKPYPKPYGKVNCSWIQDLNVNTFKILRRNSQHCNYTIIQLNKYFLKNCCRLKKNLEEISCRRLSLWYHGGEGFLKGGIKDPNHKAKESTTFV